MSLGYHGNNLVLLLCYIGGPLYQLIPLGERFGDKLGFALSILPIALLSFGCGFWGDERARLADFAIHLGSLGLIGVYILNGMTVHEWMKTPEPPSLMMAFGAFLSIPTGIWYLSAVRAHFSKAKADREIPNYQWGELATPVPDCKLAYRPRNVWVLILSSGFFALCAVVIGVHARDGGGFPAWVLFLLTLLLVAAGVMGVGLALGSKSAIEVRGSSILIPNRIKEGKTRIERASVLGFSVKVVGSGERCLSVCHGDDRTDILLDWLRDADAERVLQFLGIEEIA